MLNRQFLLPMAQRLGLICLTFVFSVSVINADDKDFSLNRVGQRGYLNVTAPLTDHAYGAWLGVGADYTTEQSLVYKDDQANQIRRVGVLSIVPYRYLEFSAQYRTLDTNNAVLQETSTKAYGDAIYGLKASYPFEKSNIGVLTTIRRYVMTEGFSPAFYVLARHERGNWDIATQTGWEVERNVVIQRNISRADAFAWQKPSYNSLFFALASSYQIKSGRLFVEYSTNQYIGGRQELGEQPHRLAGGMIAPIFVEGLVITPNITLGHASAQYSQIPAEPTWRAGALLTYEIPVAKIKNALFPSPGRFTALVQDQTTLLPANHVQLILNDKEHWLGVDGTLSLELRQSLYLIRVSAPGYLPVTDSISILAGQYFQRVYKLRRDTGIVRGGVYLNGKPGLAYVNTDKSQGLTSDSISGLFSFELPPGQYRLSITAPGFSSLQRGFTLRQGQEVVFDRLDLLSQRQVTVEAVTAAPLPVSEAAIVPLEKVEPIAEELENTHEEERQSWLPNPETSLPGNLESPVFFEFGKSNMDQRALPALDRLAKLLLSDPTISRVIIEGRADAVGSEFVNLRLASQRAEAVAAYLTSKGVLPRQLSTTKTVYHKPAIGQTEAQRAQDRRVGFRIER